MTKEALDSAIAEAKRFLDKAQLCKKHWRFFDKWDAGSGQHAAAAKRASMDLTKALALIRKP